MSEFDVSYNDIEFVPFPEVLEDMLLFESSVSDNDLALYDVSANDVPVIGSPNVYETYYSQSLENIETTLYQIEKDLNIFLGFYILVFCFSVAQRLVKRINTKGK